MDVYIPGTAADCLIMQLWYDMKEAGDLDHIFGASSQSLTGFIKEFQAPTTLFYETDERGICRAGWIMPLMGTALIGLWARENARGLPVIQFSIDVMRIVFTALRTALCVVRREHVQQMCERFGWKKLAALPEIYNGHDATAFYMTREMFEEKYGQR
jgi:hypothetical protein